MFRTVGMGSFHELLKGLSKDPAMVFYLDNCMSHKGAINENWGRELLELFSLGVGMDGEFNYSEDDVKEAVPGLHRMDCDQLSPSLSLRKIRRKVHVRPP